MIKDCLPVCACLYTAISCNRLLLRLWVRMLKGTVLKMNGSRDLTQFINPLLFGKVNMRKEIYLSAIVCMYSEV